MILPNEKLVDILSKSKNFKRKKLVAGWLAAAEQKGISLYEYLTVESIIESEELGRLVADAFGINYVDLKNTKIDLNVLNLLPEVVAKENGAIVFAKDKNGIHLAVADPTNDGFIKNFQKKVEDNVVVYLADPLAIKDILQHAVRSNHEALATLIQSIVDSKESIVKAEDIPIIQIVNKLLEFGYVDKASDIHVEPYEEEIVVRFRIDGILHDVIKIPKDLHELIVTRIKILSRLRTDEHRAAQDGKLRFNYKGEKVDVRVSIIPVIHGEKVVMRLLSEKARQYDLENLGFNPVMLEIINSNIRKPWGMILSTGPTGCGKTTSLYAIIQKLNKPEVNISTIEDPVEYDIDRVNQIQVNPKTNLTFATGLRSIVRQDPDIIMVGEIRDQETAQIAINSAMTGHLVLSTLHTNDAATTLPRLLDMGIQSFLVASTINLVIAQRLVRKICEKCKYKVNLDAKKIELITKELSAELIKNHQLNDPETVFYYGKGCQDCQDTGYKGRLGIFEILEMDDNIKTLVMTQENAAKIKQKAIEQGMIPMIEDGINKVLAGVTTIDELLRVAKE